MGLGGQEPPPQQVTLGLGGSRTPPLTDVVSLGGYPPHRTIAGCSSPLPNCVDDGLHEALLARLQPGRLFVFVGVVIIAR